MKKLSLLLLCTMFILAAVACSAVPVQSIPPSEPAQSAEVSPTASASVSSTPAPTQPKYLITASIDSECLKDNLIDTSPKRTMSIYLPPSYYDSDKAYPVVYYLHGYGEPVGEYIRNNKSQLDKAFKAGAKEFIFAAIDGGVSMYVNSPITGNWEDYFLNEIIPYVDGNYRTIPDASSRGICGCSMGGFGSINLALKHPDIFSAVYSMSPGLFTDDGLPEVMGLWTSGSQLSTDYARAFAPNANAERLGDVPKLDGSDEDNIIVEKWMAGFGDLKQKMQAYIALDMPLKGIGFSYGTEDFNTWIPKATKYFSDLLRKNGIDNSLYTFKGGHTQPPEGIEQLLIPFFNQNLEYED